MTWVIYALSDPRTPTDLRYVGKTHTPIETRVSGHLTYARKSKGHTHLVAWLKTLISLDLRPHVELLESGTGDWQVAERKWILWHRKAGYRLCNATDGGEGASPGHVKSAETKARMSAAMLGKKASPEARARMSAARKGRGPALTATSYKKMAQSKLGRPGPRLTPEQITRRNASVRATWQKKIANGWKPIHVCSPEGRARTVAANTDRPRPSEVKAKIAAAKKGQGLGRKLSPETRAKMSAAQKARHEVGHGL